MSFKYFETAAHATSYNKFRPSPPKALIKKMINFLSEKCPEPFLEAADIGCGGGQSTQVLAPFFKRVVGIDPSDVQITQAQNNNKLHNVIYKCGSAEHIDLPSQSVQLVTAVQACHWFDLPKFYAEVERILVSGGVLALYGYLLPQPRYDDKHEELCQIVDKYYSITLGKYVLPESKRVYVENYKGEDFSKIPFVKDSMIRDETISSEQPATLADLTGYISSWSAFQNYKKIEGDEKASRILQEFEEEFKSTIQTTLPSHDIHITIKYKYFLLMGRKLA